MFEFGRDLRKLFEKARECEDLGWLELIGADLVEAEARRETTDAGRVSCPRPFSSWNRAAALWREHARRTGRRSSLDRARAAASDAMRQATTPDQRVTASICAAETHLLQFDLFGGPDALTAALSDLRSLAAEKPTTRAALVAVSARLTARRARLSGEPSVLLDATALLDAALHAARSLSPQGADELRLDRASLALEGGVMRRDGRLLDQAGRDLRVLVESASPEYRPLTRARALALAGAGLLALARLAENAAAAEQGMALFEAAADQFTPDHSPLDWVAVQLVRSDRLPLDQLAMAEQLSTEPGLILGALARGEHLEAKLRLAEAVSDVAAVSGLEAALRRRLSASAPVKPVDWAADQIGMARLALAKARLTGSHPRAVGLMLAEAIETARECGAPALMEQAVLAMPESVRL